MVGQGQDVFLFVIWHDTEQMYNTYMYVTRPQDLDNYAEPNNWNTT